VLVEGLQVRENSLRQGLHLVEPPLLLGGFVRQLLRPLGLERFQLLFSVDLLFEVRQNTPLRLVLEPRILRLLGQGRPLVEIRLGSLGNRCGALHVVGRLRPGERLVGLLFQVPASTQNGLRLLLVGQT